MWCILLCTLFVAIAYGAFECQQSNTWVELPKLPEKTGETASAVIGNDLYVAGEGNTETYKFSFNNSAWSRVADRVYKGNHENAFVLNKEWWLVGGIDANSYGKVQVYNPQDDKWSTRASMPYDGGSVCVALINEVIYACGGIVGFDGGKNGGGTNTTNKCAKYDISSGDDKWEMESNMPYRRNHAATSPDNKGNMWIFGGREGKVKYIYIIYTYIYVHMI